MTRILKKEATGSAQCLEGGGEVERQLVNRASAASAGLQSTAEELPPPPYTGRPPAEDPAAEEGGLQGHRLADNPATGHCALHPFSHPSILPIVQKTKPRLRGAKQRAPDTRASNKR